MHFLFLKHKINRFIVGALFLFLPASFVFADDDKTAKEPNKKTAVEILLDKRIHATTQPAHRPSHVYRPKTPLFHKYHPDNQEKQQKPKRHPFVKHPDHNKEKDAQ